MPKKKSKVTRRVTKAKPTKKKRHIQAEDLLKLELVGDAQVSPDGSQILFSKKHIGDKNQYITNLWIVDTEGGAPRQFTSGGKDAHGRWSPDGSRIAFIAARDKAPSQVHVIPAAGGEATALTCFPEGSIGSFAWSPDSGSLAVAYRETDPEWTEAAKKEREETGGSIPARVIDDLYYRLDGDGYFNAQRFHLYVVDAATGKARKVFDRDTIGWFSYDWSPNSSELVVTANTSKQALLKPWKVDLFRINVKTGKAKKIPNLPDGEKEAVKWSPDGKHIAYVGTEGREIWGVENTRLYLCNPDKGDVRDITGCEDYCMSVGTISDTAEASFGATIAFSPDSRRLFVNIGWHGQRHIASIPVRGGKFTFHTRGRKSITMGNLSADGSRIALCHANPTRPDEVALGSLETPNAPARLKLDWLTKFNKPLLDELELPEPEMVWLESKSGTKVQTWVIKPPDFKEKRKYPAVLEIHGGPHAQYGEAFFHEMQLLAASGYVVFFSNPRGSKGYGEEHCTAIRGTWGAADWEDIQAVTAFMQSQKYVDNKRMGVMGGSYGGYMTNWAISHCHDFAGAITDRCVSNLVSMTGSSDLPLVPGGYWPGNSWDDIETIWDQSPLKHFGNVKTPTMVIHSEGDLRCNVEQGEQIFAALKLQNIPTRFVRYPTSTSHGLSRMGPPDLRLHRLGQILEWWGRWLR
jgi:dipeptidyl aminopeptidase/acylaminoacyl peptidase